MKLKKTGILLLALTFILQCFPVSAAEVKEAELSYETQVVSGLEIMELGKEYDPSKQVTRVDFAKTVYNLINFRYEKNGAEGWDFYADENTDSAEIKEVNYIYSDIDDEIDGYIEIEALAQRGIMIGDGSGNFNPQNPVTKKQAVTVMLRVLGYTVLEDYSQDFSYYYDKIVADLELMEQTNDNITYGELATLVYNTMSTKPLKLTGKKEVVEETEMFMEKYMGLSYIFGTVTNTGFVALNPDETLNSEKLVINNSTELYKSEDNLYAEYIGRKVNCFYYNKNSNKEGQIAFLGTSHKNVETEIPASYEPAFNRGSNSISYTVDEKTKSKKLNDGFVVIKNNQILESYSETDFQISSGSISVVETDTKDVVIINSYKDFFVSGVDEENLKLYNAIKYTGEAVLELDNDNIAYYIQTQNGEEITIDKLKAGNVLSVCEGATYIGIIVSEFDSIQDTVVGLSASNGKTSLSLKSGNKLVISNYYSNSADAIVPEITKEYYFYINAFGEIAYISIEGISVDNEIPYGYCWYVKETENEDYIFAKILNEKNNWKNYQFAPVFRFARQDGSETRISKYEKLLDFLNADYGEASYKGIIRYTLNDEGKIDYFEVPITDTGSDKKGQLKYIGSIADKTWIINSESLGSNLIVRNNVKMIVQKPQQQDEHGNLIDRVPEDYSIQSVPFVNWGRVTLDAYTINGDTPKADYIIRTTSDVAVNLTPNNKIYAMALTDPYYIWDEYEGEVLLAMDVINCVAEDDNDNNSGVERFVFKGEAATVARDSFKDFGSSASYSLSKGDIFRYAKDSDGNIIETMLVWDESEPNKITTTFPSGNLAGSIGYYSDTAGGLTNPFGIKDDGTILTTGLEVNVPVNYRVIYGSVYKKYDGNILRLTTQPIKGEWIYDETLSDTRFVDESIYLNTTNKIIAVTFDGKTVSAKNGSMNDIRTYEEYGEDCSRIVACSYLGVVRWVFIINGDSLN